MAARKLQAEIERTLKKVAEGVEIFEGIFDKINTTQNQTQKEKLEVDLKSQIKKLQRLRDQIKTWSASNDIKDKQPLLDNRKLIETQMERFKACEKEMKTKAFSKEGLSAAAKLDPKEKEKLELCQWITSMVDELGRQIEQAEAEVETLQLLKKKKDSDKEARLEQLETLNERRSWHVNRLELILRLLENGNLQTDAVSDVKDDIAYFVESNTEEDFDEDEGIYDELNLEEEEDLYQVGADDHVSSHDSVSVAEDVPPTPTPAPAPPKTPAKKTTADSTDHSDKSPAAKTTTSGASAKPAASQAPPTHSQPARKSTLDSTTPRPTNLTTPSRSVSGPQPTPRAVPTTLPPIRYAAAAAAANASATSSTTAASTPAPAPAPAPAPTTTAPPPGLVQSPLTTPSEERSSAAAGPNSAAPTEASSTRSAAASSAVDSTSSVASSSSAAPSPMPAHATIPASGSAAPSSTSTSGPSSQAAATGPSPALSAAALPSATSSSSQQDEVRSQSQAPTAASAEAASQAATSAAAPAGPVPSASTSSAAAAAAGKSSSSNEPRLPSSLADLVTSFESAKQKSMNRDNDLGAIHQILDSGFSNVPQPLDAEKPKYYVPRQPFATPAHYPQEPLGQFANPALFAKLDVDTLFYIFYYCQGTYLQYLAASELKKQSWRFHKQYLTWFQRANEPQQITDEYEQGVYLYFDWEGSWCQRRKNDFKFSYKFLDSD